MQYRDKSHLGKSKPARSIKPPVSNRPPLFRGGKLISPPKVPHPPPPPLHLYSSKTINVN